MSKFKVGDKVIYKGKPSFIYEVTGLANGIRLHNHNIPLCDEEFFELAPSEPFVPKFKAGDKLTSLCDCGNFVALEDSYFSDNYEVVRAKSLGDESSGLHAVRGFKKVEFVPKFRAGDLLDWHEYPDDINRIAIGDSFLKNGKEVVGIKYGDGSQGIQNASFYKKKPFVPQIKHGDYLRFIHNDEVNHNHRIAVKDSYLNFDNKEVVDVVVEGNGTYTERRVGDYKVVPFKPTFKKGDVVHYLDRLFFIAKEDSCLNIKDAIEYVDGCDVRDCVKYVKAV